jgi:large subunit ribosomal protein L22
VKKCLQSAIANAENNHNLDVDSLIVAEAWVGKNLVMKRGRPRARGRFGKIMKPFSEITIKVRQKGSPHNGSEGQSDRYAPPGQPHLGQPLVC